MKSTVTALLILLIVSGASSKESIYTASTPAGHVVRSFLQIPLSDSVDFIRWRLVLSEGRYNLYCNYGIGKPNTNGFINGGDKIELYGIVKKEENIYQLQNGAIILKLYQLNPDLLHLLDENNNLLVGNGGWSYTLNNVKPVVAGLVNKKQYPAALKDSMAFEGRTPCKIPGIVPAGTSCYKLKWYVVLYASAEKNKPGTYRIKGTPFRRLESKSGNWEIITRADGITVYQLKDDKNHGFLSLVKPDENILLFIDTNGKLLVGDENFSYTLNRRF